MNKRWLLAAIALGTSTPAFACTCEISIPGTEVQAEIKRLESTSVALDGIVTESDKRGSWALVQPKRIWFGDRLSSYRIKRTSNCSAALFKGQHVRIALRKLPPERGIIAYLNRMFIGDGPQYQALGCSLFEMAMYDPAMRRAIQLRRRSDK